MALNLSRGLPLKVDPLEGTNFAAKNLPGALSVICIASKGNLFNAPETYMDKIAINGSDYCPVISLKKWLKEYKINSINKFETFKLES